MSEHYTLVQSIRLALHDALEADPNVMLLGEDIGKNGGVFRATEGLQDQFGHMRVLDTPLSEALIAGLSVGLSTHGLKPIAEFQFMGFIYPAIEQIISHISRMRNRTRGRLSCPLVIRAPYSGGIHAPEHHSESTEALFAHIPGLRVVIPTRPSQAYGLLRSAIESPDPVIYLEPKKIYHTLKEPIDRNAPWPKLDQAQCISKGHHLTLIAWGAMLPLAYQSAQWAHQQGISVELIDLVSIKPLDLKTLLNSVRQTGRCLIVHEAARTAGLGAELAASLQESAWGSLLAPIMRITGYDTVMPYAQLESYYLPQTKHINHAITTLMEYPG